ncbi:MAG: LysE family transporter [Candidatus Eisenbacteria sp.]|nr:LysE family transporter [Candidatus Eisenbacteria bacterium]
MIGYVLQGIGLGFAGGAQPGPFQAYAISQTLRNGWRRSLPIALAPLISDGPIILLVLLVLRQVPPSMTQVLHFASAAFLVCLAWGAFAKWRSSEVMAPPEPGKQSMFRAVIMNFLNPGPYIYWSLVAGPTFLMGWRDAPASGVGFLAGFYVTLVSTFGAVIVVFGTARRLGPKVNRAFLGVSALALAGFALYQLYLGLTA